MSDEAKLARKLDQLSEEPPITLESVDWTIRDPMRLNRELGRTFRNFQRVEQEVNDEVLETLLPNLSDQKRYFISIWRQQENPHGNMFSMLRVMLGNDYEDFSDVTPPLMNRLAGNLGRVSHGLHESFEMIYLARGAMHERLTKQGYELMSKRLTNMGEIALRDTLVAPILKQEAHHLGYYLMAARQLRSRLRPWQMEVVNRLSVRSYAPVGAGAKKDKPDFGHTAISLVKGTPDAEESAHQETYGWTPEVLYKKRLREFSSPIQKIGQELLSINEDDILPDIVFKGIMECVEAEKEAQAQLAA